MTEQIYSEAKLTPAAEKTGSEWEVTIIGADNPGDVVTVEGREYLRSKNGRLYSLTAIKESAPQWDGVKVYDNHLTQAEFEAKQGMRSPVKEWLGTIVKPRWDEGSKQLRGTFKVVEAALASKLKAAWEQGVLGSIGLSIDTFPVTGGNTMHEGQQMPLIEGFKKILSVDLVGDPAAGGGFNRILASIQDIPKEEKGEQNAMTPEEIKAMVEQAVDARLNAALEAVAAEDEEQLLEADVEEEDEEEEMPMPKGKGKKKKGKVPPEFLAMQKEGVEEVEEDDKASEALYQIKLLESKLTLQAALAESKLSEAFALPVRQMFEGRIFESEELNAVIKSQKQAQASIDNTGRVVEADGQRSAISVGLDQNDKFAIEFMRLAMGSDFDDLKGTNDQYVAPRLRESVHYQAWDKAGRPDVTSYNRLSSLLEAYLGGNPVMDGRAMEAATTSSLATVVKNTVNIMTAANYSQRDKWYEAIVKTEEVATIDDVTLARLYGASNLDVVNEGAAYTELVLADEEETAAFVKNGNYVGITMETLMRDKVNYVRDIPNRMANAWYNTLSAYTAAVFTCNSGAGPVLSDSGALFNATAAGTAGGHANLLTTALTNIASFGAARTAMRKQTDQPLGAGRKLSINPAFLLVPEDLETTAITIRNSERIPGSVNNDINPFYQKFEVVVVPDWTDATDWALVANPKQWPAIYHIFPRGYRTPQLFTADSEVTGSMFTNDTLRFKVKLLTYRFSSTYACSPVADFRPLHKSVVNG